MKIRHALVDRGDDFVVRETQWALDTLRAAFRYDASTGVFVRSDNGRVAGWVNRRGYHKLTCSGISGEFSAHRVAWAFSNDAWPEHEIDHIDGDKTNNRLANLRPATRVEQLRNQRGKSNRSGYKGVTWCAPMKKWRARICVAGQVALLGYFDSPTEAALAYDRAAERHFGVFAKTNEMMGRFPCGVDA